MSGTVETIHDPFVGEPDPDMERRNELIRVNDRDLAKEALAKDYGEVLTTAETQEKYQILQFMAPYVLVTRLGDGKKGTLQFSHLPRYYFNFQEE
jgi:hypothetical protein